MFNPRDIIETLANNVKQTASPFGIPKFMVNKWYKDVNLPKEGEYLLITGLMYQFTPFIEKSTHYLEKYEGTQMADLLKYIRYVPSYISGIGLAMMTSGKEKKKCRAGFEKYCFSS